MADTTYELMINRSVELDGAAALRKPRSEWETDSKTLPLYTACKEWGRERVMNLLLQALDTVRSMESR